MSDLFEVKCTQGQEEGVIECDLAISPWFFLRETSLGKTAGELRASGLTFIDPKIPDCAELKKVLPGEAYFEWYEISFEKGESNA